MTDGWIKFYLNETDLLVSTRVGDYFPPKFMAFSRSTFEESSRIFFDCPEKKEERVFEEFSSTVVYETEFVGELQEGIDIAGTASWLSGGRVVFFVISFWICKGF